MKFMDLTFELLVGFILLFIIVKVVGRVIISQISPFTFISAVVLGELLGNALYDHNIGISYVVVSMFIWGGLLFTVEFLSQKFLPFRKVVEGEPSILIENGNIKREALKKNRINISQLQSLLRQSETFSIREVAYCYLESNGSLSILKKAKYQKTTQGDFNMPSENVFVPVTLIRDGEVLWDELKALGFNEAWLTSQLSTQNISNYHDVFLAEWLQGDGLFVQSSS